MAFALAKASFLGELRVVLHSKIAAAKQRETKHKCDAFIPKPGVKIYFSRCTSEKIRFAAYSATYTILDLNCHFVNSEIQQNIPFPEAIIYHRKNADYHKRQTAFL